MKDAEQQMLDSCMDSFDFSKVSKVMKFLGWRYAGDAATPTDYELRQMVREYINMSLDRSHGKGHFWTTTGGFVYEIYREEGNTLTDIRISFELESSEANLYE